MGPEDPNSSWQAWVVSALATELSSCPSKPILNFIHSPKRVTDFSRKSFKNVVYVFSLLAALVQVLRCKRGRERGWQECGQTYPARAGGPLRRQHSVCVLDHSHQERRRNSKVGTMEVFGLLLLNNIDKDKTALSSPICQLLFLLLYRY